ncbi:conjugative transfer ATPase [Entomomonas asaccharolytica]|uniref:Conjugative transfer ATPase n=1 Tax=Entomomonas asaccharolytica TaxID=2785331 RepID=A0A974RZA4_9GAMM|nr:conjugative transfer ATPase [Entomomonas asaccharolytica]QQP86854.1 conjugative transfer ATPase [Entomomonas asaccharolytica]
MLTRLKQRFSKKQTPTQEKQPSDEIVTEATTGEQHWRHPKQRRATKMDEQTKLYSHEPGFTDYLPYVEYLADSQCFLLEDNQSMGAIFELTPIGTEGRTAEWLQTARDTVEDVLQDSFDEFDTAPWVVQFYCQDDNDFTPYIRNLQNYIKPQARGTALTEHYISVMEHHTRTIAKQGGLFEDTRITKLPWRGKNRRVRLVIYRWLMPNHKVKDSTQRPEHKLNQACERVVVGLSGAGVKSQRMNGHDFYDWLMPWFNPKPSLTDDDPIDFYRKVQHLEPKANDPDDPQLLDLPFDHDFAERLFFSEPTSDVDKGIWYFDNIPHTVVLVDQIRNAPKIGQITGETHTGDQLNALFDQFPEDTTLTITMLVTPQDILEDRLNMLDKKAIGENLASTTTRSDVKKARHIIASKHKLYRGSIAFYLKAVDERTLQHKVILLNNILTSAGLQPVKEGEEVAACNSYLRWLPMVFNPNEDPKQWYTRLYFAQHIANLSPLWGRTTGTGHPCISFFNRGGGTVTFDPLSQQDRSMNAHMLIFGPTGSGKSASLVALMIQVMAVYRPRIFIVEAGNSFGLLGQFFKKLDLTVNQVSLKMGSGITLAPFADARLLVERPDIVANLDVDAEAPEVEEEDEEGDSQRDILGEMEIIARLMITGGEAKEDHKLSRADRSLIRQCILDAATKCVKENRPILTEDVYFALKEAAKDPVIKENRSERINEMAESILLFTQGFDGEIFNRKGASWPESDVTIVDLATYAREGYEAQMAISYISLMNTVNNIAERDQYDGRPIIMVTDEGHIITKNPLVAPYAVKITKMWRKLGAWFWLATQNLADFPNAAETMLNMIEWWTCLNMPPDEVEAIARFKSLNTPQKQLLLSATKEPRKYTEGVVLSKTKELMFRAVPPSLILALAETEPEEKRERFEIMKAHNCSELEAVFIKAEMMDKSRGVDTLPWRHFFESEK